jgi:hypothetical protein
VDGWFIRPSNSTPISPNGLHVVISALRNFYDMMIRGVWVPEDRRNHPLYADENPMYSSLLLAWRREHRMWIRNVGAPDYAGIRSESRVQTARQPVGFFQLKRQPLEPPIARDAEAVRMVILAGVRYMIENPASRESVILRILLESGARVSEVLSLTSSGLRQAHNPQIGIDVKALECSLDDFVPPVRLMSESVCRRFDSIRTVGLPHTGCRGRPKHSGQNSMRVDLHIVDAHVHLNQLVPDWRTAEADRVIEAGIIAMDALGIDAVLIAGVQRAFDHLPGMSVGGGTVGGFATSAAGWCTTQSAIEAEARALPWARVSRRCSTTSSR